MTPGTALALALGAFAVLAVAALWLVDVPLWGAIAATLAGLAAAFVIGRRLAKRRDRQKTEA